MSTFDDHFDDFDDECGVVCPNCMGAHTVPCYCGGDNCFCENQGDKDCPTCGGEGEVTEEVHDKYLKREKELDKAFMGGGDG